MDLHEELDLTLAAMRVGRWSYSLTASGEIDLYAAPRLREALESVPSDVRHVLVDLTAVSFIDSVGLATLVAASRRFEAEGARMLLVLDDARIRRILEVTGVDRFFELRTSEQAPERELVGASLLESLRSDES